MAFELHEPTSYAFYGIFVAAGLGLFYMFDRFETYQSAEAADRPWNDPELMPGESRLGRAARPPERREMIVYKTPGKEETAARAVAIEGDFVELAAGLGELTVNDEKPKDEALLRRRATDNDIVKVLVPRGCVMALCEQRGLRGTAARDSRGIGPVELLAVSHVIPPKTKKADGRSRP